MPNCNCCQRGLTEMDRQNQKCQECIDQEIAQNNRLSTVLANAYIQAEAINQEKERERERQNRAFGPEQ